MIDAWLAWLDQHNGAVVAVATVVNVIVAAVYALFTYGLWRLARQTLGLTQQSMVDTHIQADASTAAANAAMEQARVTEQMFEGGNRPYLVILSSQQPERRNYANSSRMDVVARFSLENRGSVPAVLTSWRLEARTGQQLLAPPYHRKGPDLVLAVFPGGAHPMPEIKIDIADRDVYYREHKSILFEAEARYEGLARRSYSTRVVTEFMFSPEEMRYETREIRFE